LKRKEISKEAEEDAEREGKDRQDARNKGRLKE
jgi:hypothetical protein